jgi:hypothetical protein
MGGVSDSGSVSGPSKMADVTGVAVRWNEADYTPTGHWSLNIQFIYKTKRSLDMANG